MTSNVEPPDGIHRDLSIPLGKANLYGLALMIPAGLLLTLPYVARWGWAAFGNAWNTTLTVEHLPWLLGVLAAGAALHELLHGLTWAYFGQKPRSAIRYGFHLKTVSPYAHCIEPMSARAYRLGAAMPGLLLGVLPWLAGVLTGNGPVLIFGLIFTLVAAGDAMVLWQIRGVAPGSQVLDHPTQAGCYVFDREEGKAPG
jgi:hypothetical protein